MTEKVFWIKKCASTLVLDRGVDGVLHANICTMIRMNGHKVQEKEEGMKKNEWRGEQRKKSWVYLIYLYPKAK